MFMLATRASAFVAIAGVVLATAYVRTSLTARSNAARLSTAGSPTALESAEQSHERILFFEQRLARNPNDIDILNRLSGFYLQRLRESGAFSDLDLALRTSRRSLTLVPAVRNVAGLTARAMARFASHEFGAARDDARTLTHLDSTGTAYALLGDAYAELGAYGAAENAYEQLRRSAGRSDENVVTRRARMALLRGDNEAAKDAFAQALAIEVGRSVPSRERVAWYSWQLGDTAFFTGDYDEARARYDDALAAYPGYFRALASSARLDAAQGDMKRAVAEYGAAIDALPDPTFIGELGDVYAMFGNPQAAEREYALVDFIGHLSAINGVMYNRQLVMFDADHDRKSMEAFQSAQEEYRVRHDILGADAVAWTALKAGKLAEAREAMRDALRLGTRDPRLLYHAGMIARASGSTAAARTLLAAALHLSPHFDLLQSAVARRALSGL